MSDELLVKNQVIAVGEQTTEGTAAVILSTLVEAQFSPPTITPRKDQRSDAVTADHLPGKGYRAGASVSQSVVLPFYLASALRGSSGAPALEAWLHDILQCCGFTKDSGSANDVPVYKWVPHTHGTPHKQSTVAWSDGNRKNVIKDVRGAFSIQSPAGGSVSLSAELQGVIDTVLKGASALSAGTVPSVLPPVCVGTTFAVTKNGGGTETPSGALLSFDFSAGQTLAQADDMTAAEGYAPPVITGAAPTLSLSYLVAAVATDEQSLGLEAAMGDDGYSISLTIPSPTTGCSLKIEMTDCQVVSAPEQTDSDGLLAESVAFAATEGCEVSLTITTPTVA